ncbi:DUF1990 family protein [Amnibacterium flavum]|uniref:DUF1990 domain-containing protein n=1 Tax=Amnibacterium flavum TaxID=2173173 RepID=A0A2V1HNM5_9MICO|nr:DUF1990 domain-containing protein [Amnibacterium flavum]PVZ94105.1 DUF1990 domain-containing protein [Amnibacterium flavum]
MVTGPMRSGEPRDSSLNYAAIGATQTDEILQYPPKGYRAFQASRKIGSGQERFDSAARLLMTWGVLRGSGVEVLDITPETAEDVYAGVDFDADGRPIGITSIPEEELFAPDGTPYVAAGTTAVTVYSGGPFKVRVPIKVVYVIDEPKRVGYGYGSRVGAPAEFERLMVVELTDDGSVVFTIRAISRVTSWYRRVGFALLRLGQKRYTDKYLTALHPTRSAGS